MGKTKIETTLEIGALTITPAKLTEGPEGEKIRAGCHGLKLKLTHKGRGDVIATYLGTIGSEPVAVRISPSAGGLEDWSGSGRIGSRKIAPSAADDGPMAVSFELLLEGDDPRVDFLPLVELWLGMAGEEVALATCYFAKTQESLPGCE